MLNINQGLYNISWTSLTSGIIFFKIFHKSTSSKGPEFVEKSLLHSQMATSSIFPFFFLKSHKTGKIPALVKPTQMCSSDSKNCIGKPTIRDGKSWRRYLCNFLVVHYFSAWVCPLLKKIVCLLNKFLCNFFGL